MYASFRRELITFLRIKKNSTKNSQSRISLRLCITFFEMKLKKFTNETGAHVISPPLIFLGFANQMLLRFTFDDANFANTSINNLTHYNSTIRICDTEYCIYSTTAVIIKQHQMFRNTRVYHILNAV